MGKILVAEETVYSIEETYILEERKRTHCRYQMNEGVTL